MSNNVIDILIVDNEGFIFNVDGKNILLNNFLNIEFIHLKKRFDYVTLEICFKYYFFLCLL